MKSLNRILQLAVLCLLSANLLLAEDIKTVPEYLVSRAPQTVDEIKAMEEHVQALIQKVGPATVSVSGGSGVVVSEDGYILTVGHVGQRAGRNVMVTFPDGKRVRAKTLGNNQGIDAGLMKIVDEGKYAFAPMGQSGKLKNGFWCLAVGFPVTYEQGKPPAVRLGRILQHNSRALVSDCLIMGGDSGGPLFDLQGNVIGISSRVTDSLIGNVHVPVDNYRENWERLAAGEDWNDVEESRARRRPNSERESSRPQVFLGVNLDDDDSDGVLVLEAVSENSPAARAGLLAGDVIQTVEGVVIDRIDNFRKLLLAKKSGEILVVVVKRGSRELKFDIKLEERE